MTSPKESYEDKGYKPQDVALAIIGAGLANAIALVALSTPLTLWNTIVGIIILCILQAYALAPGSSRRLNLAYAATWSISFLAPLGIVFNMIFRLFGGLERLRSLFSRLSTPSPEELFEASWAKADGEEPTALHNSSVDLVQRLLQRLPLQYREVLVSRFLLSLSIKDTSLRMGLTEANVKVLQLRALKRAAGLDLVLTDRERNGNPSKEEVKNKPGVTSCRIFLW